MSNRIIRIKLHLYFEFKISKRALSELRSRIDNEEETNKTASLIYLLHRHKKALRVYKVNIKLIFHISKTQNLEVYNFCQSVGNLNKKIVDLK